MGKNRLQRAIDVAPRTNVGTAPDSPQVAVDIRPPDRPIARAPQDLALTTTIEFTTASPSAIVTATWDPPPGANPQSYVAQISEVTTFDDATTLTLYVSSLKADFHGRRPGVTYYVRVAAWNVGVQGMWTSMSPLTTNVNRIVAAQDTTAAAQPTSCAGIYIGTGGLNPRSDIAGLNLAQFPSILVELGNMKNATDAGLMESPAGRQRYADAVARGIASFLSSQTQLP